MFSEFPSILIHCSAGSRQEASWQHLQRRCGAREAWLCCRRPREFKSRTWIQWWAAQKYQNSEGSEDQSGIENLENWRVRKTKFGEPLIVPWPRPWLLSERRVLSHREHPLQKGTLQQTCRKWSTRSKGQKLNLIKDWSTRMDRNGWSVGGWLLNASRFL